MASKEQLRQLEETIKRINADKKYDSEDPIISMLNDRPMNVETISSGSLVLDQALGGGFGKGRIIEVYGPESSGKTSIALTAVGNVQREGGTAVFIDAENALDPHYAAKLGVNLNELVISQPSTAEQALDLIQDLTESGMVNIIVLDSVAALVPQKELEGNAGDLTVGEIARILSRNLRKLVRPAVRNGTTILFLNQIRDKIGGWSPMGTPQTTTGGKALKFYASQRLKITKGQIIKEDSGPRKGEIIGNQVKFKVEKNKIAPPFRTGMTVLTFNHGINRAAELLEVGQDFKIINRPNNRKYVEANADGTDGEVIGNSKAEALRHIETDPDLMARLERQLRHNIDDDLFGVNEDGDGSEPEAEEDDEI